MRNFGRKNTTESDGNDESIQSEKLENNIRFERFFFFLRLSSFRIPDSLREKKKLTSSPLALRFLSPNPKRKTNKSRFPRELIIQIGEDNF